MAKIYFKEIAALTLTELQGTFPSTFEHLTLSQFELGPQKENSIIIGNLTEVRKRKNVNPYSRPVMRLTLQEVLANGQGLDFNVNVYGKNVKNWEDMLNSKDDSPTTWVAFSNVSVIQNTDVVEPWSPFSLVVADSDDEKTFNQQITIFRQSKKLKKERFKTRYALISEVSDKNRYNTFAVVKDVIKHMTLLNNNNKHMLLSIVDPSCFEPSSKRKELLLHIFFNDSNDYLPEAIKHGDILRLREMLGDCYKKEEEGRMHGKIFSSHAIVKFKLMEAGNEVTPLTSNSNYELTDQDRRIVKDLRRWWRKNCNCYDEGSPSKTSVVKMKKISDILKPSTFTLNCLIKNVRIIESQNVVVLRVADGTSASVFTTTVNIDDATQEFSSQPIPIDSAVNEATEIDVTVFKRLFEQAIDLKEGDFVELVNISCEDIGDGDTNHPILDFFMKEMECEINVLSERSCKAKKIVSALDILKLKVQDNNKNEEISSASGSVNQTLNNKRHEEEPITKQRLDIDSTFYPAITEDIDLLESETENFSLVENGFESKRKTVIENTNACGATPHRSEISNAVDSKNNDGQKQRTPAAKRKLCESIERESKRKVVSCVWQPQELNTVCNVYKKALLTDFFVYSKGGEKCQVWAILKHIHFVSKRPCEDCLYRNCYHDWVWGLCSSCGTTLSSHDIRERYPKEILLSESSLKCQSCPSQSTCKDSTVLPFIKLELHLEDTHNDNIYSVDLSGDAAKIFFGINPSFKWVVGPVSTLLQERTNIFKQLNQVRPFQFCLVNRTTPNGTSSIQICDTRLKF